MRFNPNIFLGRAEQSGPRQIALNILLCKSNR
jgi:hypothetical protein